MTRNKMIRSGGQGRLPLRISENPASSVAHEGRRIVGSRGPGRALCAVAS
ncbi:MAG: hypothetical protein SVX38_01230 [Chloroflexota bacterium]|nr:hypothetical protein [Chloroflexota bacterium]